MSSPLTDGDLRRLAWGSHRWSIAKEMRLLAEQGYRSLGLANDTYAALVNGGPATLTREQVTGLLPESGWPADVDEHDAFVLTGDDDLAPVE